MTFIWLLVYVVVSSGGRHGGLLFDPINWWTGTLIFAIGADVDNSSR